MNQAVILSVERHNTIYTYTFDTRLTINDVCVNIKNFLRRDAGITDVYPILYSIPMGDVSGNNVTWHPYTSDRPLSEMSSTHFHCVKLVDVSNINMDYVPMNNVHMYADTMLTINSCMANEPYIWLIDTRYMMIPSYQITFDILQRVMTLYQRLKIPILVKPWLFVCDHTRSGALVLIKASDVDDSTYHTVVGDVIRKDDSSSMKLLLNHSLARTMDSLNNNSLLNVKCADTIIDHYLNLDECDRYKVKHLMGFSSTDMENNDTISDFMDLVADEDFNYKEFILRAHTRNDRVIYLTMFYEKLSQEEFLTSFLSGVSNDHIWSLHDHLERQLLTYDIRLNSDREGHINMLGMYMDDYTFSKFGAVIMPEYLSEYITLSPSVKNIKAAVDMDENLLELCFELIRSSPRNALFDFIKNEVKESYFLEPSDGIETVVLSNLPELSAGRLLEYSNKFEFDTYNISVVLREVNVNHLNKPFIEYILYQEMLTIEDIVEAVL